MPKGYFDPQVAGLLSEFRDVVSSDRLSVQEEKLMEGFPDAALAGKLRRTWQASATAMYRNWLRYIVSNKTKSSKFSAVSSAHENDQRTRAVGLAGEPPL